MSKKAKKEHRVARLAGDFISNELEKLRDQQERCERQAVRGRKLLNLLHQQPAVSGNVADLILERCGGFGETDKTLADSVIVAFGEALTSDWKKENGAFLIWFFALTADITHETTTSTLWGEDTANAVFLCVARYLKSNARIEAAAFELLNKLKRASSRRDAKDSDDDIDWRELVYKFLDELNGDPFIVNCPI